MIGEDRNPPDIAFFIYGFGVGGSQRVASLLINAWADAGLHVHAYTMRRSDEDFFQLSPGVRRTVLGSGRIPMGRWTAHASNLRAILRIRASLRRSRPKVVVSFITASNVFVILATIGLSVRVVVSERNDPLRQDPGRLWGPLRRLTYRFADAVTANSVQAVDAMRAYVPARKLAAIPNPVRLPATPARPTLPPTLLTVGRLVPQKGQALLVAAFTRLESSADGWRLTIVGEGPERLALERHIAAAGLRDRIALPGTVPDPERYYRSATAFVLASAYEGTPNTLLEAMAHGLPCVVADCLPGALEYVEDGVSGLVYRAGDADDLCRCLQTLMSDSQLRTRLGVEGRERVARLSIEHVVKRWDDVLFPIERGCGGR